MNREDFIKGFHSFIAKAPENETIGGWNYSGKTTIAYGSPGGSWDINKFPGYRFDKGDKSLILRLAIKVKSKYYIAVEAIHAKSQLVNLQLTTKNFVQNGNSIKISENFVMTVKFPQKKEIVRDAMYSAGFAKNNVVCSFSAKNPDFNSIISSLIAWAEIREKARIIISETQNVNTFSKIIVFLKERIENENSILKDFQFHKTKANYVWISDHKKEIGNSKIHYEIIKRHKRVFVELHFEGNKNENNSFSKQIKELPKGLEWLKWPLGKNSSKSIRVKD